MRQGGNQEAARLSGINVKRVIVTTFIINGVMVGIASTLLATQFSQIQATPPPGLELFIITAAVVGVILNLAVWFALHTLFAQVGETHRLATSLSIPVWATVNWAALAISVGLAVRCATIQGAARPSSAS